MWQSADLVLLSVVQRHRPETFFPRFHGLRRVDGRQVMSWILYVIRHGRPWSGRMRPRVCGSPKTLWHPALIRWGRLGVYPEVSSAALATEVDTPEQKMIGASLI